MSSRLPIRSGVAAALLPLLFPAFVSARPQPNRRAAALSQFEYAQKLRQELDALPRSDRRRSDFQRVIEAFRKVYLITPASGKADASLECEAEVLAQEGRQLGDPDISRQAIKQYEFLLAQYPGTRFKPEAMVAIGKIEQDDLADYASARREFEDFLKLHPMHPLSPEARAALAKMGAAGEAEGSEMPSGSKHEIEVRVSPNPVSPSEIAKPVQPAPAAPAEAPQVLPAGEVEAANSQVTGIRYWSAPDYTRVEIALSATARYEAGRIPSPERVFFDLHGARIASALSPRSYDVRDGLVQRIRIAEFQRGTARIVLEVAAGSNFSAHWAENPARLIVDIRPRAATQVLLAAKSAPPSASPHTSAAPAASSNAAAPKHGAASETASAKPSGVALTPADPKKTTAQPELQAQPDLHTDIHSAAAPVIAKATEPDPTPKPVLGTDSISGGPRNPTLDGWSSSKPALLSASLPPSKPESALNAPLHRDPAPEKPRVATRPAPATETAAPSENVKVASSAEPLGHEAAPEAGGGRTLIRALGLKIGKIVIDAGHGGHDTGTIGPHGLMEKDLVLDVALRLGKLLESRMGAEVVYTRSDDTFIPLQERTAIANQDGADLFISIHANSSRDPHARGVEVYYLNFTSSADALEVAARENASSEESIHDLQDLVKQIALQEKIDESREFATDVDHALHNGLSARGSSMRDRGVKKAPFVVLIGAHMPSILAEISFLSNPKDEKMLEKPAYRERIAEALYRGVSQYAGGLGGIKLASARSAGQ